MLQLELSRNNQILYKSAVFSSGETSGRLEASVKVLQQIYPENPRWLDLVEKTAELVREDRIKRGAGEKPVLRKYDPNEPAQSMYGPNIVIEGAGKSGGATPSKANTKETECIEID
jgi:hypothetical protein